jgi:hypothetical protein
MSECNKEFVFVKFLFNPFVNKLCFNFGSLVSTDLNQLAYHYSASCA